MTRTTEEHVQLARQVADSMEAFGRARRLEAASVGSTVPPDPPDVTAGLICGFARAYRRMGGHDRQLVPRAIRYLGRSKPEYSRAADLLMGELGSESVSVWSDFAEAIVEASARSEDPSGAMLEFASLIRLHGLVEDDLVMEFDPTAAPAYMYARAVSSAFSPRVH
jgi:hypothetical protein